MNQAPVHQTRLQLPNRRQRKVRDLYDLPSTDPAQPDRLLIVASDRLSAFDVVMPTPFPGKGALLTEISLNWFNWIEKLGIVEHHILETSPESIPIPDDQKPDLLNRIMICRKTEVVPIECVARGYITGSGWKDYQRSGKICGIDLPTALLQCQKLSEPIFTPASKADVGHDENISFQHAADAVGRSLMEKLRHLTLEIYTHASQYAADHGIIIADTKFEFGRVLDVDGNPTDEIILIDEVLTPDSSRFWPSENYDVGRDQQSFDKQFLRNYLESLVAEGKWDKTQPGPEIPAEVVTRTVAKYADARDRLFGSS